MTSSTRIEMLKTLGGLMDPDASLEQIRALLGQVATQSVPQDYLSEEVLEDLAVLVEGLDDWMSKGGFLPKAWQR